MAYLFSAFTLVLNSYSPFLLATYGICKFSRFRTFYTQKNEFRAKKKFRLSRGVAMGFCTKFEAQLAQP
jgi:hypothetical protein